ncbi:flagellar protein FlaG [Clostridium sp. MSJ-11]|uniref:Flagellar protein FlaG n=1 Tax=Clostridium mobile TaxID=2841512 RepID=A0ABS6EDG0_9CLOT|nr:flagellar protein FlaG [Clostridium mobile]MBU5483073.1 flagellar protein FlaG [Clostridium mobile]
MDVKLVSQGGQINFDKNAIYNEIMFFDKGNGSVGQAEVIGDNIKIQEDDLKKAVDTLNKTFNDKSTYLEYEVYGKTNNIIVRIMDKNTKEIVKEIPPKKIIDMVDKLCELAGVFMDERV